MPAKTIGNLKKQILAYMTRSEASMTINAENCLLAAINSAKDFAQRALVFKYSEAFIQVPNVSLTSGGSLANAQLFGTSTACSVRSIRKAFLSITGGGTGQFPIAMWSREAWAARLQRRYENSMTTKQSELQPLTEQKSPLVCVPYGRSFYIYPADADALGGSTFTVYFDGVLWIDDFTADGDTHWLLDYAFDFLLFRGIYQLNFFMKEDQRVPISEKALAEIWANVVNWNETTQGLFTDDANLD